MKYEILFAQAQNQLPGAKIPRNCGMVGIKRSVFSSQLADFLPNTYTSSRIRERFFKQISFHANFTFGVRSGIQNQVCVSQPETGAKKRLCNLTTVRKKGLGAFWLSCASHHEVKTKLQS
ncbi:MAG: hypothetical protein ACYSYM_03895 [Planctomycetota bacterium]